MDDTVTAVTPTSPATPQATATAEPATVTTTARVPRTPAQVLTDIKKFLRNLPLEPDVPMRTVVNLFEKYRELFLDLALVGVPHSADENIRAAARIAARLKNVNRGFRIEGDKGSGHIIFFGGREDQVYEIGYSTMPNHRRIPFVSGSVYFTGVSTDRVRKMCDGIYFPQLFGPFRGEMMPSKLGSENQPSP